MKNRTLYIALFTLLSLTAMGQTKKLKNQPKYDKKPIHFGFFLGVNWYDLRIDPVENLAGVPNYHGFRTEVNPGYSIGIISDLRLSDYFTLRFIPTFATTERKLYFDLTSPNTGERRIFERDVESSFIDFPFYLKYRSSRINNYRWYVLGGVKYSLDLSSKQDVEDDLIFKLKRNDVAAEVGIGLDFYFEYFKFSPQLKASFGTNNLLVQDGTQPVEGISAIYNRAIFLNLTFE
ncbi:MAG: porin family protein [Schleiferiaceae bacterium]